MLPSPTRAYTLTPLPTSQRLLRTLLTNTHAATIFAQHFKVTHEELVILRDRSGAVVAGKREYLQDVKIPQEALLQSERKSEGEGVEKEETTYPPPKSAWMLKPLGMSRRLLETLGDEAEAKRVFEEYFEIDQIHKSGQEERDEVKVWYDRQGGVVGCRGEGVKRLAILSARREWWVERCAYFRTAFISDVVARLSDELIYATTSQRLSLVNHEHMDVTHPWSVEIDSVLSCLTSVIALFTPTSMGSFTSLSTALEWYDNKIHFIKWHLFRIIWL